MSVMCWRLPCSASIVDRLITNVCIRNQFVILSVASQDMKTKLAELIPKEQVTVEILQRLQQALLLQVSVAVDCKVFEMVRLYHCREFGTILLRYAEGYWSLHDNRKWELLRFISTGTFEENKERLRQNISWWHHSGHGREPIFDETFYFARTWKMYESIEWIQIIQMLMCFKSCRDECTMFTK